MDHVFAGILSTWNFSLIQGSEVEVTVGKVILILLFLFLGHKVSKKFSSRVSLLISKRFGLPLSTESTIKTLSYYFTLVIILLFILQLLEIPLTIFTVLGGAVAIGVGFGSQNIVKNFLSGMTVLLEQPIRVGDFIELDQVSGIVEEIGFRATRLKTGENTHIIIPNSTFLDEKVLNWTLSDDIIRGKVSVGVAYGSDLNLVSDIFSKLDKENPKILSNPKPFFYFSNFGDSALEFDYFFFTKAISRRQVRIVESELRFLIDKKFREANIIIAFPQLDVHLNQLQN